MLRWAFWGLSGKESLCQCRKCGFNPWVRKIPGKGNGDPLWYYCQENPIDRGPWWATYSPWGCKELDTSE